MAEQAEGATTESLAPLTPEQQFLEGYPDEPASVTEAPGTKQQGEEKPPEAATQQPDEGATSEADDTFTRTDLDALLGGIQDPTAKQAVEAAYKSFQGDYTRKTQELAAQRAAMGDNPEEAQAAMEFYRNLQEDPMFALEVHGYLSNALQQMGLTEKDADEAATQELASQQDATQLDRTLDDQEDLDSPLKSQLDSMQTRLDKYEQREQERLERQEEDELAATLIAQEMSLRQTHPSYEEKDFDRIYDLSVSTGGNLHEAAALYEEMRNDFITGYMSEKGSVSDRVTDPVPATAQIVPEVPHDERGNVDIEEVHKVAMQRLFNHMAEREAHG